MNAFEEGLKNVKDYQTFRLAVLSGLVALVVLVSGANIGCIINNATQLDMADRNMCWDRNDHAYLPCPLTINVPSSVSNNDVRSTHIATFPTR